MVADEPTSPATPSTAAPAGPNRRSRVGRILLILAVALGGVVVIGGGAAFVIYDKATAIDRSTPAVVVDQFLDAALVLKDPSRVSLFVCNSWSAADAIAKAGAPTDSRVRASWGDITSTISDGSATATATVRFSVSDGGGSSRSVERWRFGLQNESGWRICGLTKL